MHSTYSDKWNTPRVDCIIECHTIRRVSPKKEYTIVSLTFFVCAAVKSAYRALLLGQDIYIQTSQCDDVNNPYRQIRSGSAITNVPQWPFCIDFD